MRQIEMDQKAFLLIVEMESGGASGMWFDGGEGSRARAGSFHNFRDKRSSPAILSHRPARGQCRSVHSLHATEARLPPLASHTSKITFSRL